jgi:hypothetical protein
MTVGWLPAFVSHLGRVIIDLGASDLYKLSKKEGCQSGLAM